MLKKRSPHLVAALQALFVTFLWSTSWILVKIGLEGVPPLTFAGLRYVLAFSILLPFAVRHRKLDQLRSLSSRSWGMLILLGLLFYAVTQGTVYWALLYLPATTLSLLLNFSTVVVAFLGILFLGELLNLTQWLGVAVFLVGAVLYFYPVVISSAEATGLVIAGVCILANSLSSVLGRHVNRLRNLDPMAVTVVSMGIGSWALLGAGILVQGLPPLSWLNWGIILWLAVVNSAFAFTLWNHTLRTLPATESSIINNTMLIQIAVLAWIFLGEKLTWLEIVGLALATVGAVIVQLRRVR